MRRRSFIGLIAAAGAARGAADDERVWKDYLEWYRTQPTEVSDPLPPYLESLRQAGMSEAAVRDRGDLLRRLATERREELHPYFFDRTYSSEKPRFNAEPNALLVDAVRDLKPGRALDIHMGQGRNALYLASRGWDVTGFDFSAEGVHAAEAAARKAELRLKATVQRHEDFDFGRSRWDLVLMSYTWVPLRPPYLDRIVDSLAPAGVLVFEHMMDESGSERAAAWLPRPNQLFQVFSRLRVLRYEDVRAPADWSWRPERVARLIAMRDGV